MLHKIKGIVLHTLQYSDKYIIINMYTDVFGRVSYMAANSRSKKTKIPHALLMPLSILEMEVEHLNNRDLQRIREVRSDYPITNIYCNPIKNTIALFLSEVLFRVIQEKESNPSLFDYLYRSIQLLEVSNEGLANFHLAFLFQLSDYLGIHPNKESYKIGSYFDLQNGVFTTSSPEHNKYLNKEESVVFARLLKMNYENMSIYSFSRLERINIIQHIIDYYRLHISDFPEIKSIAVMQSIFDA